MSPDELAKPALKRLQIVITVVLVGLFALSVVVALAELWPVSWLDEIGANWFGRSSWRVRIIGTFCVFCVLLLGPLIAANLAMALWRRLR